MRWRVTARLGALRRTECLYDLLNPGILRLAAGPWLVAKLAALLAVWLMMHVLLKELTLANLKPFAIWHRGAA
jgi:hypothetical protein